MPGRYNRYLTEALCKIDDDKLGFIFIRIHNPPGDIVSGGIENVKFHSLFTDEGKDKEGNNNEHKTRINTAPRQKPLKNASTSQYDASGTQTRFQGTLEAVLTFFVLKGPQGIQEWASLSLQMIGFYTQSRQWYCSTQLIFSDTVCAQALPQVQHKLGTYTKMYREEHCPAQHQLGCPIQVECSPAQSEQVHTSRSAVT
ncbi:hypothetical protein DFH08DRAFT_797581 [Mycena albidolilacea]|uniref:Uncharacterized protein n=1 Tax=Mycena albidolilacea TaxID=1033008 RepID=A0AAD7F397_9AGAR|nr:hypothetical protein DFH08DRAFT_797581 [Mycena albidolilacea]